MLRKIIIFLIVALGVMSDVRGQDVDCSQKPERVDPRTCCAYPELTSDENKEQCKEHAPPEGAPHRGPPHLHSCYKECLLNATEILVNDELDVAKLTEILGDASDMQPIVEEAITTCVAKHKEMQAKRNEAGHGPPPPPPGGDNDALTGPLCHHFSSFFLMCVRIESFKNCPSDRWNDTQQCNDLRDHMIHCKPKGPYHHHGPHGPHGPHASDVDN